MSTKPQNDMNQIGLNIAYFRKAKGMKQKDLAAATGIPESTVSERMRDPAKFTLGQMQEIIKATQMGPEAILKYLGYKHGGEL